MSIVAAAELCACVREVFACKKTTSLRFKNVDVGVKATLISMGLIKQANNFSYPCIVCRFNFRTCKETIDGLELNCEEGLKEEAIYAAAFDLNKAISYLLAGVQPHPCSLDGSEFVLAKLENWYTCVRGGNIFLGWLYSFLFYSKNNNTAVVPPHAEHWWGLSAYCYINSPFSSCWLHWRLL